ncbi:MAG TPA: hypothetical protein VFS20_27370 [Longimicrobium sp.]|nr:hypothetical protein [Longimicrobium sp.]
MLNRITLRCVIWLGVLDFERGLSNAASSTVNFFVSRLTLSRMPLKQLCGLRRRMPDRG